MLVAVTIFGTSVPCGNVLKAEVNKILLTRINKNVPMNIIICSPQGNIHRITQVDVNSSIVSRLSKLSDSSSLTLSICQRGGRKSGVKNRTKFKRIIDELINC